MVPIRDNMARATKRGICERGDARNDFRLATGVLPGNRLFWIDVVPIPSSVYYRVR